MRLVNISMTYSLVQRTVVVLDSCCHFKEIGFKELSLIIMKKPWNEIATNERNLNLYQLQLSFIDCHELAGEIGYIE